MTVGAVGRKENQGFGWCCRRGLNSRPPPYQGGALPLSYGSAGQGQAGGYSPRPPAGASIDAASRASILPCMDKEPTPRAKPAGRGDKLAERRKREAEALRANLRKRKDQTRAREKPKQE